MQNSIIQQLKTLVSQKFAGEGSGHDWHHIDRVRKTALHLAKSEGGDLFIIECAALLHDISDHKFNGGDELAGGEMAYRILIDLNCSEENANAVKNIINEVSFKGGKNKTAPSTLEGRIVQDADRLDAIGAIGVARTFAYGGYVGNSMYDPESNTGHTIQHFYDKLLKLKDLMNTGSARKIAEKRHQDMEIFLENFYDQWLSKDFLATN